MDCCTSTKDDKINDETDLKNVKQEDNTHEHSHGGCYGEKPWKMVVVMVLFTIIMILLRR